MTARLQARERITRSREDIIASRLRRFAWRHRAAVSELARRDTRLADLAVSFPALLFALAVPRRRFDAEPLIARTIAGASLGELAAAARTPTWLRKLPPETFQRPLPACLPDGDLFRRQIANHRPRSPKLVSAWLDTIANTGSWGHDGLAIWFARHMDNGATRGFLRNWPLLSLWAWHAQHADHPASKYLTTRWTPEIAPAQASEAIREWTTSVNAALDLGDGRLESGWAESATVDGYTFEPVLTADELMAHATTLNNCARTYAYNLAKGWTRLWIVSQGGKPVAMLEYGLERGRPYSAIRQLTGPSNAIVPPDLWLAALRWERLHTQPTLRTAQPQPDQRAHNWKRMWRPYWLAKRQFPSWLPLAPRRETWRRLVYGD